MKDDRPQGERPKPADRDTPKRPTPVRELMDAGTPEAPETPSASDEPRRQEAPRTVTVDGEDWIARAQGSGRSGRGKDAGAPLLLVTFTSGAPDGGGDDTISAEREVLAVGASLDDLSHDQLTELFLRSKPSRSPDV